MEQVKKFALIIDGRNHIDEDHWNLLFYSIGLRPDANVCVPTAEEALELLAKEDSQCSLPQAAILIVWDDFPEVDGLSQLELINKDYLVLKNLPVMILSSGSLEDQRRVSFGDNGAGYIETNCESEMLGDVSCNAFPEILEALAE